VIGVSLNPVLNPASFRPCLKYPRVLPQPVDAFGLLLQHVERGQARRRYRRRVATWKTENGPRAMVQVLDQVAGCRTRIRPARR